MLPAYSYIPGENERHAENAFDDIKQSVWPGQDVRQLAQSAAFHAGLKFIEAGFYWEAHEVLEPVWMCLPEGSDEKRFVQGLIQLANGRLKLLMQRPKAALRLVEKARELMPDNKSQAVMKLDVRSVLAWIEELEQASNLQYSDKKNN